MFDQISTTCNGSTKETQDLLPSTLQFVVVGADWWEVCVVLCVQKELVTVESCTLMKWWFKRINAAGVSFTELMLHRLSPGRQTMCKCISLYIHILHLHCKFRKYHIWDWWGCHAQWGTQIKIWTVSLSDRCFLADFILSNTYSTRTETFVQWASFFFSRSPGLQVLAACSRRIRAEFFFLCGVWRLLCDWTGIRSGRG